MPFGLIEAHAMLMIVAWMVFAPTGVYFAVYARSMRLGTRRQFLGKAMWFQIHRFLFSLNPLFTLVGFLLVLVAAQGQWVDPFLSDIRLVLHSVCGAMVVCAVIVQIWLALYRCPPQSRFRAIFNWSHRLTGFSAYSLSILTIYFVLSVSPTHRIVLLSIMSCWTAENVLMMFICTKIHREQKRIAVLNPVPPSGEVVDNGRWTEVKLLLFLVNFFLNCSLSISLIVLICT